MRWQRSIKTRFLIFLMVASVLPLMVLGVTAFEISSRMAIGQSESESARFVASFQSYLRLYRSQIEDLAANIAGNSTIGLALQRADLKTADTYDSLSLRAQMGYLLNSYMRVKGLVSINIFSAGGERFQVGETLNVSKVNPALIADIFQQAKQATTPLLWRGVTNNLNTQSDLKRISSVIRQIHYFSPATGRSAVVGVLVIELDNEIMRNFLESNPLVPDAQLMALDPVGNVELHSDPDQFGWPLSKELLTLVRSPTPIKQLRLDGVDVLMRVVTSEPDGRRLVAITPRDELARKVNLLALATLGFTLLAITGISILSWYLARTVVQPLRAVSNGFQQLAQNPEADPQPLQNNVVMLDEVEQLVQGFNRHLVAVKAQREDSEQLRLAKTIAEDANLAKSSFLAMMSHEIRTPMNGVLGMAQLLLAPKLSEQERLDYAGTVMRSGQSLMSLLNDILDLSKIEAHKVDIELTEVDPEDIINDVRMLFKGAAERKSLKISSIWNGPKGQHYLSDPYRLRQMIVNLAGNALKFTNQGAIQITATEVEQHEQKVTLEFSVSDTGIGIESTEIPHLFQPFVQVDSSSTREYGGSGLGLSIVSRLAKLLEGEAGVRSVPGRGSVFWFRVRAQRSHAPSAVSAPAVTSVDLPARMASIVGLKGKVLVAEDNYVNGQVIEKLLQSFGLEVVLVTDGQLALDFIKQGFVPNVVLMDLHMPGMDGYAATTHIREWELQTKHPPIPIVALTADAYETDRQRCMSIGMDDFLTKPVDAQVLRKALERWMDVSETPLQALAPPALWGLESVVLAGLREELLPLLELSKFDAIDCYERLRSQAPQGTPLRQTLDAIAVTIKSLQFKQALVQLQQLIQAHTDQKTD